MRRRSFLQAGLMAAIAALGLPRPSGAAAGDPALQSLIDGAQRSDKNRLRDRYRHPLETLTFFGLKDDLTVVEIWPGTGGYWTEILAPYLKAHGTYYAAGPAKDTTSAEGQKEITGSADLVVTFRNVHNWMASGTVDQAFAAFFKALKPGGVLGVEEHRGRTDQPQDPLAKSGYVREDYAIALAEKAGFKLLDRSEVNANPKDTKDYSVGVWALPPSFRLKDQDREKYAAIGESDRFVLSFVKPRP